MIIKNDEVKKPAMGTGTDYGGSRWKIAQLCLAKYNYKYEYNDGIGLTKSHIPNTKAVRGSAIHEALRWYYNIPMGLLPLNVTDSQVDDDDGRLAVCIVQGMKVVNDSGISTEDALITKEELAQTIDLYHQNYKDEDLEVGMTEIYIEDIVDSEKLTGRIDVIGKYGGTPIIMDHKTTGKPWSMFLKDLKRDISLIGYVYMARKQYKEPFQMIINGIQFKKTKAFGVEFHRDLISYDDYAMEQFLISLGKIHSDIAVCKDNNEWPQNGQSCMSNMILCEFDGLCSYPNSVSSYEPRLVMPDKGG